MKTAIDLTGDDVLEFVKALEYVALIQKKTGEIVQTHCCIENGSIRSTDNLHHLLIDIPMKIDFHCQPNTVKTLAVLRRTRGQVALKITPKQRLSIKSDKIQAFVDCLPLDRPIPKNDTNSIKYIDVSDNFQSNLIACLKAEFENKSDTLADIVNCSNGLFTITDRLSILQYWHSMANMEFNISASSVKLLIRSKKTIAGIHVNESFVAFLMSDNSIMTLPRVSASFPQVNALFDNLGRPEFLTVETNIYEAIETVNTFDENNFFTIDGNKITTQNFEDNAGMSVEFESESIFPNKSFSLKHWKCAADRKYKKVAFLNQMAYFVGNESRYLITESVPK